MGPLITKGIAFFIILQQLKPSWESSILQRRGKPIARDLEILDFGTGFPNYNPPDSLLKAVSVAVNSYDYSLYQYGPHGGNVKLRKAISKLYSKLLGQPLSISENIVTTVGSNEALHSALKAYTNPGDEWIYFEPCFNTYAPILQQSNGVLRPITLKPRIVSKKMSSKDWIFDKSELTNAFNKKTRGVLINNPHNPTGKLFTHEELLFIANLTKTWNVIVISDEVYEFLIYDNNKFIRMATLPDMYERTITVTSISKTFSATGFRVGWAIGPKELISGVRDAHLFNTFSSVPFVEEGVANFLEEEFGKFGETSSYIEQLKVALQNKRDYMVDYLEKVGFSLTVPESGMFILANWTSFANKSSIRNKVTENGDTSFTNWLMDTLHIKVNKMSEYFIPENKHLGSHIVRFVFAKTDEQLSKAEKILLNWKENGR